MSFRIRALTRRGVVLSNRWEAYVVVKRPNGERIREKSYLPKGTSRRAAQEWAEKRHVHLMTHGRSQPQFASKWTVGDLVAKWLDVRGDVPSAADDRQRLTDYVLPIIGRVPARDLRPKHVVEMLEKLKKRPSRKGGTLAPSTMRSTYALLRQVFDWAFFHEYVSANPVVVLNGVLPAKKDKDPAWRIKARFSPEEVDQLTTDPRIPLHRRIAYAIAFMTGLRIGEASALKWEDYEARAEPLGKLLCYSSYNSRRGKVKETKTGVPREIPVHPALASLLREWKALGWKATHGRSPKKVDLIIPSTEGGYRSVTYALKAFHRDLEMLGLRKRRLHDCRRTFISMAQDGGASKEVLRAITHPSPKDAFDLYSTPSWDARCAAVLCLRVGLKAAEAPSPAATGPAEISGVRHAVGVQAVGLA
jgi:integrase